MSFVIRNSSNTAYTTTTGSPNVTIPAATQSGSLSVGTGFIAGKVLVSDTDAAILFSEVANNNMLQMSKVIDSGIISGTTYVISNSSSVAYTTTTGNPNVTVPAATMSTSAVVGTGFSVGTVSVSAANAALLFTEVTNKNYLQLSPIANPATVLFGQLNTANPTLPATGMANGAFDLSGQTTAQTVTFDTAANVYAVLSALPSGNTFTPATGLTPTTFDFKIFNNNTSLGAITLAAGTGNTLTGAATIAIGTGVIVRATVTATTTPTITYAVTVN
jgi:hypothetical protein